MTSPTRPASPPAFASASWPRRIVALLVDWFVSTLAVLALVGLESYTDPEGAEQVYVLGTYVLESALLTWLAGGSFGKLATGLRVVPEDGRVRPLNPVRVLLRQIAIALVVPPLVFRPDGRGLHDLMAGTTTVTADTYRSLTRR